jgi:tRNA(adenine34) deaminase
MTFEADLKLTDRDFLQRAIDLALLAEGEGNLPVGAVIALDGEIVAEGRNAIWVPRFDATRHAEVEAIRAVSAELWTSSERMSLYTTLEPCLMCCGAILLHRIGRVVFGARDPYAGLAPAQTDLPAYFREHMEATEWSGPLMPVECDPLYLRVAALVKARAERSGSEGL